MKKLNFHFKINRLVRYFLISDFVALAAWGLVSPIFSVFVIERVVGATLITIGIASGLFWFTRGVIQLFVGEWLDESGEKTTFYVMITGLVITASAAFSFIFVRTVSQLYLVQFVHALGAALYVPSWLGSFSRHLDRGHNSFEWALQSTTAGIASGITGFIGGAAAYWFGYASVFAGAGALSLVAIAIVSFVPELVFPKPEQEPITLRDHTPRGTV